MPDERHVWIIDAIEGDVAAVEEDGERLRHVGRWLLPSEAHEGTVLIVTRTTRADGTVRVEIAVDTDSAAANPSHSKERPRNPRDRGGDIVL